MDESPGKIRFCLEKPFLLIYFVCEKLAKKIFTISKNLKYETICPLTLFIIVQVDSNFFDKKKKKNCLHSDIFEEEDEGSGGCANV